MDLRAVIRWVRPRAGVVWCTFEGTALSIGDDSILPPWTSLCRPREEASDRENNVRLILAVASVGWTAVHLLAAWVRWLHARRRRAD